MRNACVTWRTNVANELRALAAENGGRFSRPRGGGAASGAVDGGGGGGRASSGDTGGGKDGGVGQVAPGEYWGVREGGVIEIFAAGLQDISFCWIRAVRIYVFLCLYVCLVCAIECC